MSENGNVLSSVKELRRADQVELKRIYRLGTCPNLNSMIGRADGFILASSLERLRLWRGKRFESISNRPDAGHIHGLNRLGLGPFEVLRYRFTASVLPSVFNSRMIVKLDHDLEGNPGWVRRFHDEVVQVGPGLFLAHTSWRLRRRLIEAGYFALHFCEE